MKTDIAFIDGKTASFDETADVKMTPHGIEMRAPEREFDAQMAAAREVMARRRRALRELSK